MLTTNGFKILKQKKLPSPLEVRRMFPLSNQVLEEILGYRKIIADIISGQDPRFLVVAGPCSIDGEESALEYARKLKELSDRVSDKIFLMMRVYLHKPRTTVGWKGILNDPDMNGVCDAEKGILLSRKIITRIASMGVPIATEALDNIAIQYIADGLSLSSIGARSTPSPYYRELLSGLSMPVGVKNDESGKAKIALDAIEAIMSPQLFFGIDLDGCACAEYTKGNKDNHLILRGGISGPNYDEKNARLINKSIKARGLETKIVVDASHGNCVNGAGEKDYHFQSNVFLNVVERRVAGENVLVGAMIESNLEEGSVKLDVTKGPEGLPFGVSKTDACISFKETERIVLKAYKQL